MYKDCRNKSDIITNIANDARFRKEIESLCQTKDIDDLLQEIYLSLFEKNEEFLLTLNKDNKLKFFIIRMILNQFKSKSSRFYRLFKKHNNHMSFEFMLDNEEGDGDNNMVREISLQNYRDIQNEEDKHDNISNKLIFINRELDKLDWYDHKIFNLYYTQKISYTELAEKLNISRTSIVYTVAKVKNKLKRIYAKQKKGDIK